MTEDLFNELHHNLPAEPGRIKHTRKAFRMLPELKIPRILDIACGPGVPTLELARLSGGEVIGIDVNQEYLDKLATKAEESGLADRVTAMNCSLLEMPFPPQSFDILWAEGAIWIIGFRKGLEEWRQFLKPQGFMVIHDGAWLCPNPPQEVFDYWRKISPDIMTVGQRLEMIRGGGYEIIGSFPLPDDYWWVEYYQPLEKWVQTLRNKYAANPEAITLLDKEQREIDMFRKSRRWYGSSFFVMQRR